MFIDANIFLEIALKDSKYEECEEFLKNLVKSKKMFFTSDFLLYSCLLIIHQKLNSIQAQKDFLVFINSIKITILRPSLKGMYNALEIMEKYKLDFDDALVISCMRSYDIKNLISYDKDFEKVKELNIIKP